jgi:hypothetical protein
LFLKHYFKKIFIFALDFIAFSGFSAEENKSLYLHLYGSKMTTKKRQPINQSVAAIIYNRCAAVRLLLNRFALGQAENFFFRNTTFGAQHIKTLKTLHDITDFADFAADSQARML